MLKDNFEIFGASTTGRMSGLDFKTQAPNLKYAPILIIELPKPNIRR
jgi:hypothetical protein